MTRPVVITGGAGFIGTNLASRLLNSGQHVRILDSLARPGVEHNLQWLSAQYPRTLEVVVGDVRDAALVERVVSDAGRIFHLAAQVAVTSSLESPLHDFDVNARGTLVLLEAVRRLAHRPPILFTSTNKVYGALHDLELRRSARRYEPADDDLRATGLGETRALDLHSPYGCSKGCADQYALDYARCFGVRSVVFRMSCIYGPHQRGTEDQGWVAHFLLRARAGEPITIYGDGLQVRDLLHVDDLLDAFELATTRAEQHPGSVYNMGGGAENAYSLLEVLDLLSERHGLSPRVQLSEGRVGDQRYFVADTARFREDTGWAPRIPAAHGIGLLLEWFNRRDRGELSREESRRTRATGGVLLGSEMDSGQSHDIPLEVPR
jgi:CDP-paratose 2-epimerase